jgi:hypothetical protein
LSLLFDDINTLEEEDVTRIRVLSYNYRSGHMVCGKCGEASPVTNDQMVPLYWYKAHGWAMKCTREVVQEQ